MSNYTKKERKAIAAAFKKAKKYLNNGTEHCKPNYICWALEDSKASAWMDAVAVITERLGGHAFVSGWLEKEGYDWQNSRVILQQYRHRWLDALIEEFSN